MLPGDVETMFQQAFTESGVQPGVRRQKRGLRHLIYYANIKEMYRFGNACLPRSFD